MGQLKYHGNGYTQRKLTDHKTNQPGLPANHQNWNNNIESNEKHLSGPENNMVHGFHFFQWSGMDLLRKILGIIHQEHEQRSEAIQGKHVHALVFVHGFPWLGRALAHEWHVVDVIVNTVNIGIGMVNDIVFQFPHESIASKKIMGKSENIIDPSLC